MGTVDPASLPTNFDHQLEHATELRKLAYAVIQGHHKCEFTRAHNLALTLFYRSLQTHEATEILIRQRLVEDARVLVRVLAGGELRLHVNGGRPRDGDRLRHIS